MEEGTQLDKEKQTMNDKGGEEALLKETERLVTSNTASSTSGIGNSLKVSGKVTHGGKATTINNVGLDNESLEEIQDSIVQSSIPGNPNGLLIQNEGGPSQENFELQLETVNETQLEGNFRSVAKNAKGKKERKTIEDILGLSKANSLNIKGRNNKQKSVVFRAAVSAAALTASVSAEGIVNRNRILLNEAQAVWECNKLMGIGYDGDEDEVISKIAEMEAQDLEKACKVAEQL